ncbi:MAG TPA: Do family serine endopeptidase [Terriglobales bacterium]|nr:Do family serine endopeptidase [Terriglobales bacterium]
MRSHRFLSTILVVATLFVGILIGTVVQKGVKGATKAINSSDATPLKVPAPQQLSSAFSQVAKQLEPSVVNINTESTPKSITPRGRRRNNPGGDDNQDPFQDFFDRFFGGQGGSPFGGGPGGGTEHSLGSGVIVDSKGYIITNQHVVEKADRIRVKLDGDPPGLQHDAKVVGSDSETDLAVIKIEVDHPLAAAKLGNSESMNVGDWVLAIGSPFALEETVTAGIVSSKGRDIDSRRQFQRFIQTDAAINPGNSGGPLVNMNSEVIGINTAIFTESGGYQGVGFALPSNIVAEVYNQLISPEHKVVRGSIGVAFNAQPNPAIARMYGSKVGVVISSVTSGGPADQAGLKIGDTITSVNGKSVKTGDELVADISAEKPGSKVKIGYERGGKSSEATVTVADRAKLYGNTTASEEEPGGEEEPASGKLGISVRAITPDMADRLSIPANKGVIVTDVKPGSFAEDIGLSRGDVILEVNKQAVNSEDDFRRITSQLKSGQDAVFLVRQGRGRNASTIFLAGTLP